MVIIQQQYVSLVILQSEAITLSFQSAIFSNKMKDDFIGKNNDSDIHAPDILSFWILTVCQDNLLCAVSHFLIVELKHLGRNKAALLQLRNSVLVTVSQTKWDSEPLLKKKSKIIPADVVDLVSILFSATSTSYRCSVQKAFFFLPQASGRRWQGRWHQVFKIISAKIS